MMAVRAIQRLLLRNTTVPATASSRLGCESSVRGLAGLAEFFESEELHDKSTPATYGRGWKASELRLKSWDDLQKLWYVLLKEKNVLLTQRRFFIQAERRMPNPERMPKVRKSMCRIKQVLTERVMLEPDKQKRKEMRRMIDAM